MRRGRMQRDRITVPVILAAMCLLTSVLALAVNEPKAKGMIISRSADTLILKPADGQTTVVLDDSTKVQQPKGLGLRKRQVSSAVLIPGLKVSVEGKPDDQSRIVAKTITFDGNDLETAE